MDRNIPQPHFDLSKSDRGIVKDLHRIKADVEIMRSMPDSNLSEYLESKRVQYSIINNGQVSAGNTRWDEYDQIWAAKQGSTLVIPVNGVIQKKSDFWSRYGYATSTDELVALIQSANQNTNIERIVFDVDSGGGGASGNEYLSKVIQQANAETIAFYSCMCSAALECFKSCDRIIAQERQSKIGSYGEMATWFDEVAAMELEDFYYVVYAPQSTRKNEKVRGLQNDPTDKTALLESLSKNVEIMILGMEEQRPQLNSDTWKDGRVFNAAEAIEINLTDSVSTMNEVLSLPLPSQSMSMFNNQRLRELEILDNKFNRII